MSPISSTSVPGPTCPQCGEPLAVSTTQTETTCDSCQTSLTKDKKGRWTASA